MIGRNVLSTLDAWARAVVTPQVDPDILDLDTAFWTFAIQLARTHPEYARTALSISTDLIDALACLDRSPSYLASGALLSFTPIFSVRAFDKAYATATTQSHNNMSTRRYIDAIYWQTLVRAAERQGASTAALVFGISPAIVQQIVSLGFTGARVLADNLDVSWRLRFRSDLAVKAIQCFQGATEDKHTKLLAENSAMIRLAQAISPSTVKSR